jgi:DNA excision repair protein ERCC-3
MSIDDDGAELSVDDVQSALQALGQPFATADQLARELEVSQAAASDALDRLAERTADLERRDVTHDPVVYYPRAVADLAKTERVVPFPSRKEIVVDRPRQFTRARLSQFARLVEADDGRYLYELRPEDVWAAPYDSLEDLIGALRAVLPEPEPALEGWVADQWARAGKFRLYTHEDDYEVLEAESASLLGNVAEPKLEDDQLRARISDTEAWVAEESVAAVKRTLYEAGYPVADERDLDSGEPVEFDLALQLRDYQQDWVERFLDAGAGVLVGPPGSGKTVAAMAIMAAIGGETLLLAPSRELVSQWREELLTHTTLTDEQVGVYHGGTKQVRPVTIATYHVAGMDRHRELFESREWGLLLFDEAHHVLAPVYRRSADLQSRHRLGLSATPVREGDDEADIYTLIGPPIGTDWDQLFDAGYVAEPELELHFVPWPERDEAAGPVGGAEAATADGDEATTDGDEPATDDSSTDKENGSDSAETAEKPAARSGASGRSGAPKDVDVPTEPPERGPNASTVTARDEYAASHGHERRQAAATNPAKIEHVAALLAEHPAQQALVFVDYLDQGEAIAEHLDAPFLSGETPHAERGRLLSAFRAGDLETLVVSRVGDEGIDLPEAEVAIVASGLGGSRRQGAQRAGRTMRPAGKAQVYVLATTGTEEEEFARQRTRHLAGKGVDVREVHVEAAGELSEAAADGDWHAN